MVVTLYFCPEQNTQSGWFAIDANTTAWCVHHTMGLSGGVWYTWAVPDVDPEGRKWWLLCILTGRLERGHLDVLQTSASPGEFNIIPSGERMAVVTGQVSTVPCHGLGKLCGPWMFALGSLHLLLWEAPGFFMLMVCHIPFPVTHPLPNPQWSCWKHFGSTALISCLIHFQLRGLEMMVSHPYD